MARMKTSITRNSEMFVLSGYVNVMQMFECLHMFLVNGIDAKYACSESLWGFRSIFAEFLSVYDGFAIEVGFCVCRFVFHHIN